MSSMHPQWFALNYINIHCRQNSSEEDHKIIEDKAIEELMIKQFVKSKSKKYHEHQLMISQLEIKIMAHDHNCLAAVSISREGVEKKMREFLNQLQNLSEDNNSSSAPEKMKEDDFKIVVSSDKNDKKNNKMEND
ncbi:uncharacterized protein CIMG_13344 [Coccidioides immitis RS]|uniref:Uncharacterized protein n=1 Tax=Coccidioides immitis (strain RS) TaxID=246410 RepID=J3K3C1_COCIM|nr:uncharacterized protein CIMG_13344 [Coccidioides immitis RS]EAS28666.3 hypothetical protein CIMG_13344 [Coccidioides immitis RS]